MTKSSCPALLSVLFGSILSLSCLDMGEGSQYHQPNNSKLEENLVTPSTTNGYVPVSALCAESTYNKLLLKSPM